MKFQNILIILFSIFIIQIESIKLSQCPSSMYGKLRKLCTEQKSFKDCCIAKGIVTQIEADNLENLLTNKKTCPLPPDSEMKAFLVKMENDSDFKPYIAKLTKQAAKLLQCAK